MALTRRDFLKRAGLVTAGSFLGPHLLRNPLLRQALADVIGDRYLVVIFLDGGNDGLNTVTPVSNGSGTLRQDYEAARNLGAGGIRLLPSELNNTSIGSDPGTGAQLALHPGFRNGTTGGLHRLYTEGHVAVIQGVGYPDPNLSHNESRNKWETGNPLGVSGLGGGWIGRYLAANYLATNIPAFCVRGEIPGDFDQNTTSILATYGLENFGFPYDDSYAGDGPLHDTAFAALHQQAILSAQGLLHYTGDVGRATFDATQVFPELHTYYVNHRPTWADTYDTGGANGTGTSTSRDLREIAKVIYGVQSHNFQLQGQPLNTRFFEIRNGGYDTHSDQGGAETTGQHYHLHQELSDAIEVFYEDCRDMGVANKVCVVVWSEFSRRIEQNANGTDHGSQGPVFVIGGAVNGGTYGKHPDITPAVLDDNDGNTPYLQGPASTPHRSTDIRDVFGTLLKHWLQMPAAQIPATFPLDPIGPGYDPLHYWQTANFDVGFLP